MSDNFDWRRESPARIEAYERRMRDERIAAFQPVTFTEDQWIALAEWVQREARDYAGGTILRAGASFEEQSAREAFGLPSHAPLPESDK